jgi:hypothetical protein
MSACGAIEASSTSKDEPRRRDPLAVLDRFAPKMSDEVVYQNSHLSWHMRSWWPYDVDAIFRFRVVAQHGFKRPGLQLARGEEGRNIGDAQARNGPLDEGVAIVGPEPSGRSHRYRPLASAQFPFGH